jgi:hypothetical protein
MAQSLYEEVVDTIMFQEWCSKFSDTSMKTLMDYPKLNEQPFLIVFGNWFLVQIDSITLQSWK